MTDLLRRSALGLLVAMAVAACGGDRAERGLAPSEEPAVPMSDSEMEETEAERQAEMLTEEESGR